MELAAVFLSPLSFSSVHPRPALAADVPGGQAGPAAALQRQIRVRRALLLRARRQGRSQSIRIYYAFEPLKYGGRND